MKHDPLYFSHGELGSLKNFLGATYYQCVWDFFSSHEEIWDNFVKHDPVESIERIIEQINVLIKKRPQTVHEFVHKSVGTAGGLYFRTPKETLEWIKNCRDYMVAALTKKKEDGKS